MQDVTRYGTAARVARLGRPDLAGKTGTTNEFIDAWFAGYQPSLVAVSWVGYDQPRSLGKNQTGGIVALPLWLGYMERVLKEIPEQFRQPPPGVVSVPMGPLPGAPGDSRSIPEYFYSESVPPPEILNPAPPPEPQRPSLPLIPLFGN